jgi:hypothetical protein
MAHWVITLVIALTGLAQVFLRILARNRAGVQATPVRVYKLPLHCGFVLFLLFWIAQAKSILILHSHGDSADGRFWFLFAITTAAVVIIAGRLVMRRSTSA